MRNSDPVQSDTVECSRLQILASLPRKGQIPKVLSAGSGQNRGHQFPSTGVLILVAKSTKGDWPGTSWLLVFTVCDGV
jgi:hypothetical protein